MPSKIDFDLVESIYSIISEEIHKKVIGNDVILKKIFIAMCLGGHVLLEGMPGLAKTTLINSFAQVTKSQFSRIQFTPDMLPADIIGTMIYNQKEGRMKSMLGPIFANIVLADEINRAPPKVHSALLQAMEEKEVTLAKETHKLPHPFFVLATQNPIDQEGTYTLPEAQLDRFIFKLLVDYPSIENEVQLLKKVNQILDTKVKSVYGFNDLRELGEMSKEVMVDEKMFSYIVRLVNSTRDASNLAGSEYIEFGVSPRASISLLRAAQMSALLNKKSFISPEDVKDVAFDVMRHRLLLSYEATVNGFTADTVIQNLLRNVAVT